MSLLDRLRRKKRKEKGKKNFLSKVKKAFSPLPEDKDQEDKTSSVEKSQKNLNSTKDKEKPVDSNVVGKDKVTQSYEKGLTKSRSNFSNKFKMLMANFRAVDESFFDRLEETLITADVGFDVALKISNDLQNEVRLKNARSKKDVQDIIIGKLIDIYDQSGNKEDNNMHFADKDDPSIFLFVGVNGVGKTTTIGKMAKLYKDKGEKVLLAAGDTFRAGAIEQLDKWAQNDGIDIVKGQANSDPASVVFDAVKRAVNYHYDILLVDTAGRQQTNQNLMQELKKMRKVITRYLPSAPQETLLVLYATTGQNALQQTRMFKKTTGVTGIILTKLDGTARGGIVLAIREEFHLPVKWVGLGEKVGDLEHFNADDFVYGLFKDLI